MLHRKKLHRGLFNANIFIQDIIVSLVFLCAIVFQYHHHDLNGNIHPCIVETMTCGEDGACPSEDCQDSSETGSSDDQVCGLHLDMFCVFRTTGQHSLSDCVSALSQLHLDLVALHASIIDHVPSPTEIALFDLKFKAPWQWVNSVVKHCHGLRAPPTLLFA